MGLTHKTSGYLNHSRLTWVAARAGGDAGRIADDARAVHLSFANENVHYTGLASLRLTHRARARLGYAYTDDYVLPQLLPLPDEVQSLALRTPPEQDTVTTTTTDRYDTATTAYTRVIDDASLFSTEVTAMFGQGRFTTLADYLHDKHRQDTDKTVGPPKILTRQRTPSTRLKDFVRLD
jgi:hypothetical protein